MGNKTQELTADNATHMLQCSHAIGCRVKHFKMRCHILKSMPDGRLKVQVYGERFWKDKDHIVNVRYVQPSRVN